MNNEIKFAIHTRDYMKKDIILYNIVHGETESLIWYDHLKKKPFNQIKEIRPYYGNT